MELDAVVRAGLQRLGVLSLDPREGGSGDGGDCDGPSSEAQSGKSDAKASSQSEDPFYQRLLESMLRHKRLSAALEAHSAARFTSIAARSAAAAAARSTNRRWAPEAASRMFRWVKSIGPVNNWATPPMIGP